MAFKLLLLTSILILSQLSAKLNYQQEFTLSTFTSEEDTKQNVKEFLREAAGDPNLLVVGIQYKKEKLGKDCISYDAVVTCYVSNPDEDLVRIQRKVIQKNKNLEELNSSFSKSH